MGFFNTNTNIELVTSRMVRVRWFYTTIDGTKKHVLPENDETGLEYNICAIKISLRSCNIELIPSTEQRKEIFHTVSEEYKTMILTCKDSNLAAPIVDLYREYMPKNTKIFIYDVKGGVRLDITDYGANIVEIRTINSIRYIPKGDRVVMYCDLNE